MYDSFYSSRAESGREGGDRTAVVELGFEHLDVFGLLSSVFVDRNEERLERSEVHQQVIYNDVYLTEAFVDFVAEHQSVHPTERMVRYEQVTAIIGQTFDSYGLIADAHVDKCRTDEGYGVEVGVCSQYSVDFVLMNDSFQISDDESGKRFCQTGILVPDNFFQIDSQGVVFFIHY